jgi:hypothetical protein
MRVIQHKYYGKIVDNFAESVYDLRNIPGFVGGLWRGTFEQKYYQKLMHQFWSLSVANIRRGILL